MPPSIRLTLPRALHAGVARPRHSVGTYLCRLSVVAPLACPDRSARRACPVTSPTVLRDAPPRPPVNPLGGRPWRRAHVKPRVDTFSSSSDASYVSCVAPCQPPASRQQSGYRGVGYLVPWYGLSLRGGRRVEPASRSARNDPAAVSDPDAGSRGASRCHSACGHGVWALVWAVSESVAFSRAALVARRLGVEAAAVLAVLGSLGKDLFCGRLQTFAGIIGYRANWSHRRNPHTKQTIRRHRELTRLR